MKDAQLEVFIDSDGRMSGRVVAECYDDLELVTRWLCHWLAAENKGRDDATQ